MDLTENKWIKKNQFHKGFEVKTYSEKWMAIDDFKSFYTRNGVSNLRCPCGQH